MDTHIYKIIVVVIYYYYNLFKIKSRSNYPCIHIVHTEIFIYTELQWQLFVITIICLIIKK